MINCLVGFFFAVYHCDDLMVEGNEVHGWTNITLKLFNFASDLKKTCRAFEQFVLCAGGIMGGDVEMNYTVWYEGFQRKTYYIYCLLAFNLILSTKFWYSTFSLGQVHSLFFTNRMTVFVIYCYYSNRCLISTIGIFHIL